MSDEYEGEGSEKKSKSFVPKQQQLFLIEFLIDTVTIDPSCVDEEVLEAQTCLTLRFLNFPTMDICEKDFDPDKEAGLDKVRFNSGKSLMFAFSEQQCEKPPPLFVEVSVNKKLPPGADPPKVHIGSIKVCLAELFRQTYEVAKYKPDRLPASKSIKDCFMLVGQGKRTMGEVGVYIRLSCLGQNVVTEFQCGLDMKEEPILFKNREGKKVFEFTGNDHMNMTGDDDQGKTYPFREGCGCLGPAPSQKSRGQGDGSRTYPSRTTNTMGGASAYTQGNRVILDVPDKSARCRGEHNVDRYKVTSKCDNYKVTQDSITDRQRTREGLTVSQMHTNPDQNCFVLRVGDKGQIPDRGKMILEFRTPKQKMLPKILPPYHEDVGTQTEVAKKEKKKKKR